MSESNKIDQIQSEIQSLCEKINQHNNKFQEKVYQK